MDRRSVLTGLGLLGAGAGVGAIVANDGALEDVRSGSVGDAVANATGGGETPTPFREIDTTGPIESYRWIDLSAEETPTPGEFYEGESEDIAALVATVPREADYDGLALTHRSWAENVEDWQWSTTVPDSGGEVPISVVEPLQKSDYRPFPSRNFQLIAFYGGLGFVTDRAGAVSIKIPKAVVGDDLFES